MSAKKPTPTQEEAQTRQRSSSPDQADFQAHDHPAPGMAIQPERLQSGAISAAEIPQIQRTLGNRAVAEALQRSALMIQRDSYPYGGKNTTPHVHEYGGDCHLKIMDRGRIRRYNIVQNGKRHTQADDAIAAAAGNQTLLDVINGLLE
jgi:hypothetical protein